MTQAATTTDIARTMESRGHIPGSAHRLTSQLLFICCLRCELTAHLVKAGDEEFWRPGGPALHRDCAGLTRP